jgi:transcription initiation factor TFIIB
MQLSLSTPVCPNCDGRVEVDQKRGESVCPDCGTIVSEDALDHGAEWRAYTAGDYEQRSRVGRPATNALHDKGLSTIIGRHNRDATGQQLSARKRRQINRLRTWNERCRTRTSQERTLKQALAEINRMTSSLGLPQSVRETAGVIYRRALDENLVIGRSIEGVATGALYAAARQGGIPRTLDEMTTVARVDQQRIARAYRLLANELSLALGPPDPTAYLPRFASELDCSTAVQRQARDLLDSVSGTAYLSGKNPVGLAAAALYASAQLIDEQLTQREISAVADITRMTIRSHYRELINHYEDKVEI